MISGLLDAKIYNEAFSIIYMLPPFPPPYISFSHIRFCVWPRAGRKGCQADSFQDLPSAEICVRFRIRLQNCGKFDSHGVEDFVEILSLMRVICVQISLVLF